MNSKTLKLLVVIPSIAVPIIGIFVLMGLYPTGSESPAWVSIVTCVLLAAAIFGGLMASKGCGGCKPWRLMKKIDSKLVDSKPTTVKETRRARVRTTGLNTVNVETKVRVPAEKRTYLVTYECAHCGNKIEKTKTKTVKV